MGRAYALDEHEHAGHREGSPIVRPSDFILSATVAALSKVSIHGAFFISPIKHRVLLEKFRATHTLPLRRIADESLRVNMNCVLYLL
jgi:hypothetical protein